MAFRPIEARPPKPSEAKFGPKNGAKFDPVRDVFRPLETPEFKVDAYERYREMFNKPDAPGNPRRTIDPKAYDAIVENVKDIKDVEDPLKLSDSFIWDENITPQEAYERYVEKMFKDPGYIGEIKDLAIKTCELGWLSSW